eukprot:COSAG01_NODE_8274_length_2847_cov_8.374818_1_plen_47_part_00
MPAQCGSADALVSEYMPYNFIAADGNAAEAVTVQHLREVIKDGADR